MKIRKRNVFPLPYPARVVILLIYLIILSYFLFFSESFGRTGQDHIFAVNLVPFKEISRCFVYYSSLPRGFLFVNIVGNIIAFIPFGFLFASLLSYRKGVPWLLTIALSALLSTVVELIQLVIENKKRDRPCKKKHPLQLRIVYERHPVGACGSPHPNSPCRL